MPTASLPHLSRLELICALVDLPCACRVLELVVLLGRSASARRSRSSCCATSSASRAGKRDGRATRRAIAPCSLRSAERFRADRSKRVPRLAPDRQRPTARTGTAHLRRPLQPPTSPPSARTRDPSPSCGSRVATATHPYARTRPSQKSARRTAPRIPARSVIELMRPTGRRDEGKRGGRTRWRATCCGERYPVLRLLLRAEAVA